MQGNLNLKERSVKGFNIKAMNIMGFILLVAAGCYIGLRNYLLFHSIVEMIIILVSAGIMIVSLNTYGVHKNSYFLFIGIACGYIAGINLLHTLTYKGMGVFLHTTADHPTQLWIAERFMHSITFLVSFLLVKKKLDPRKINGIYGVITVFIILSIFRFRIFPACFVEGQGLTKFKIISEYLIIALFSASALIMYKIRNNIDSLVYKNMQNSILLSIVSELCFTLYVDVYGISNMVGHMINLMSFYFIYKGVVEIGFREPYRLLYTKLDSTQEKLRDTFTRLHKKDVELHVKEEEVKNMEEMLLQSEEYYKMLVDLSEYAIIVHSEGRIVFANKNCAKMFEAEKPEELKGMKIMDFIHPDYHAIASRRTEHILTRKDPLVPQEYKVVGRRGAEIHVESASTPFMFRGKPAVLVVSRDVTEKKLLKEAIEQDKLKTEIFANLSHELKTPINVFFASLQLLEMYLKNDGFENNEEKIFGHIKTMRQNSYRVIKLVNNLIDINKIGSGFMKLRLQNLNVVNVVEDIFLSVAQYVEEKGIEFVFDTEIEEKITAIDPDKIERIILNLLSNAIKFTNPGGSIKVNVYDITGGVMISVKDSGTGIPEEELTNIFERFKQVDGTLARNGQGSGIGLSLVKSLVELHGGNIKVISHLGFGTEFIIELPERLVEEQPLVEKYNMSQSKVEMINVEFSDIYLNA